MTDLYIDKTIYDVVYSNDLETFVDIVNKKLDDGWQLAGGIEIGQTAFTSLMYHQSIFRHTTKIME